MIFPLLVVVLLVYLASQTLLDDKQNGMEIAYNQLIDVVDSSPSSVNKVTFDPGGHRITAELRDGRTWKDAPRDGRLCVRARAGEDDASPGTGVDATQSGGISRY